MHEKCNKNYNVNRIVLKTTDLIGFVIVQLISKFCMRERHIFEGFPTFCTVLACHIHESGVCMKDSDKRTKLTLFVVDIVFS